MATTKAAILKRAASQIGTREYPAGTNSTAYGSWYGFNRVPWCDIFVSWVFAQEGAGALIGGKFAYCPFHLQWFKTKKRAVSSPAAGDVVFFKFPGQSVTGHVGIIEKVLPNGDLQTIEGNTSSGNYGSQDNGGGVYRRVRSRAYVAGYGRPAYTAPPKPVVKKPVVVSVKPDVAKIVSLQRILHVAADGKFGAGTLAAANAVIGKKLSNIKALQRVVGVVADGSWGPKSEAARIRVLKGIQSIIGVTADGAWGPKSAAAWQAFLKRNYNKF